MLLHDQKILCSKILWYDAPKLLHNSKRYQNNPVLTPFVFSTLVTLGHHIKKIYYINFFGHEVTNFNAPQNPTFLEKKLVWIFSSFIMTTICPQRLEIKSPLCKQIVERCQKNEIRSQWEEFLRCLLSCNVHCFI